MFLSGRPHGETSVIADIFTREHGRTLGLVKGGRSRRLRPLLQTANGLRVDWRARLDAQLGVYTVELADAVAARIMDDALALVGALSLAALMQALPERDPHPQLFDALAGCLREAGTAGFAAAIVRFELRYLDELGFGLELTRCAATGNKAGLAFVSPKSGQAISQEAGAPYRDKLLPLPDFLVSSDAASPGEVAEALRMTGYFLETHVFSERNQPLPRARHEFIKLLRSIRETNESGTFVAAT